MLNNKKAVGWNDIKTIALVMFILLISIFIYNNVVRDAKSGIDECRGECKPSCDPFEMQASTKCYKGGELQEGDVCCTGGDINDSDEEDETDADESTTEDEIEQGQPQDTNEEEQFVEPSIQVTYGDADSSLLGIHPFKIGNEYDLTIKSKGTNVKGCKIFIVDDDTRNKINEGAFSEDYEKKGQCDRQITINPTEKDSEILKNNYARLVIILELEDERVHRKEYVMKLS